MAFLLVGCAGVSPGYPAKDISEFKTDQTSLEISAEQIDDLSSEFFGFIIVTFENESGDWLELSDIKVSFGDNIHNDHIRPIRGEKLTQWHRSTQFQIKVNNHNENLALGSLLALGTLAATSNNSSTGKKGTNTILASAGLLTAKGISDELKKLQVDDVLPSAHLLSGKVLIPPMLSTRKWVVFNSKNHKDIKFKDSFILTFKDENNKKYKFHVKYSARRGAGDSFFWLY